MGHEQGIAGHGEVDHAVVQFWPKFQLYRNMSAPNAVWLKSRLSPSSVREPFSWRTRGIIRVGENHRVSLQPLAEKEMVRRLERFSHVRFAPHS